MDVVTVIASAAWTALILRVVPALPPVSEKFFEFFTVYATGVLLFTALIVGLYRSSFHSNKRQQNRIAGKTYFYAFLITLTSFTVFKVTDYQRGFVFPFYAFLPFFYLLGRAVVDRFNERMRKRGYGVHNALIVGYENGGLDVFRRFKGFPELGYTIKGLVLKKNELARSVKARTPIKYYAVEQLPEVVKKERIDRAFVPSPKFITNGYSDLIETCRRERIKLKVLSPEADELLSMAKVDDIAGITLYAPSRTRIEAIRGIIKRISDLLGALGLIVLLSPVFVVTALAILVESGWPVTFKQRRGSLKGGKEFHFYKFRSMVKNADELKESLFGKNESDGALFKLKNDPRTTKVGKFIRKYSIDELPQLFNVLKGDMSLVGPRPLPIRDFNKVEENAEFWQAIKDREKLKPGITGLWQISGRSHVGFREMVLLDLYYIENQSLLFDLEILFATIPVVLFGRGAY